MTGTTEISAPDGMHHVVVTREFAAPPELLLRAYTEPDLFAQWTGPRVLTMRVEEFDVRDGGRWRYVSTAPDGSEYRFHGVFHGQPSVERIVQTFEYEGAPGHVSLGTVAFTPTATGTLLTSTAVFQSVADRDAMIASGMEYGVREGNDRLAELLDRLGAATSAAL